MDETDLKFSEDHVWVVEIGPTVRLGISDYGQEQLGEILSAALCEVGKFLEPGDTFGEVESQKTVIELPSPVTGTVRAVNEAIRDDPSVINVDPYGKGWLVEVEIDEPEELERLMSSESYETFVEE
ncbi:MAG TPA: glycine cleavage system protein GcvH [Candidatus Methylomirabilis sp.]|nr:glycine cleavage system protein GcvH [Candidatus Methylomirabilis sp.]